MTWLLWIGFAVALVVSWYVTALGWGFAIASNGFPKNRIYGVPIIMGISTVTGAFLYFSGHPGWAAAAVILFGPLLSFIFSAISI